MCGWPATSAMRRIVALLSEPPSSRDEVRVWSPVPVAV